MYRFASIYVKSFSGLLYNRFKTIVQYKETIVE